MFGFLAKIETLSESIQQLVNKINLFADKFQKTVDEFTFTVQEFLNTAQEEITDDFEPISVSELKLENGDTFADVVITGDNGLLRITTSSGEYVSNFGFIAKVA